MVLKRVTCPKCGGKGFLPAMGKLHRCEKCRGKGWVIEDE